MLKTPSQSSPYSQLYEILEKISTGLSRSKKGDKKRALLCYITYLNNTGDGYAEYFDDPRFYIRKYWDELALHRFKIWLLNEPSLNPGGNKGRYNLAMILNTLAKMMDFAFIYKLIDNKVLPARIEYDSRAETPSSDAYSEAEQKQIFAVLDPLYQRSINVIKRGANPRESKLIDFSKIRCFKTKESLIVYHRTVLNNNPVVNPDNLPFKYNRFKAAAIKKNGGLYSFYKDELDMPYRLDMNAIMPLFVYLAYYTGLNSESIKSLTINSLQKDPLTKQYYLKYYKNRGKGEAYLTLNLFSREDAFKIIKLFYQILAITGKMRHLAKEEDKDYLFIFQNSCGEVKRVSSRIAYWLRTFINTNNLKDSEGNRLAFNIRRFRKTLITKKAGEGVSIGVLQEIANHSSITTTYSYISQNEIRTKFHESINKALNFIRKNQSEFFNNRDDKKPLVYKTSIGLCTDPYSPPEHLKDQNNLACSSYNSCLICPNILLTADESLPKLIAYHKQIKIVLDRGIGNMSHIGEHYLKLDYVLNTILKPGICFTDEEISKAHNESARFLSHVFDEFVYQGIYTWNT